ncbi:hypothetical protein C4D60_Mb03t16210 [Musa balbisiana]|uniref:Uncharacterized protein n=1 Tax=Musa balbisiana TaxID=52838 RepID=A0A4S8JA85_MUSBA|nr:hypothetical protein C4D60_Mb03t16210 [Musa balbisiana]
MLRRLVARIRRRIRTSEVRSCSVPQGNGEVGGNPTNRGYSCLAGVIGDARRRGRELQDRKEGEAEVLLLPGAMLSSTKRRFDALGLRLSSGESITHSS